MPAIGTDFWKSGTPGKKGMPRKLRLSAETGIPSGEDFLRKESLFILPLSFRPGSNADAKFQLYQPSSQESGSSRSSRAQARAAPRPGEQARGSPGSHRPFPTHPHEPQVQPTAGTPAPIPGTHAGNAAPGDGALRGIPPRAAAPPPRPSSATAAAAAAAASGGPRQPPPAPGPGPTAPSAQRRRPSGGVPVT